MHAPDSGYGLWLVAAINAAFFIFFAWSFYQPSTRWDWRGFGMFSAFVVALFAEMYGFPLTLYVLGGWLSANYPQVDWLSHDAGHLLEMWFGWRANPHFGPFHIASFVLIGGGFWLLHRASDGFETMIDGREVAPMAATPTMYQDAAGKAIDRASRDGALSGVRAAERFSATWTR